MFLIRDVILRGSIMGHLTRRRRAAKELGRAVAERLNAEPISGGGHDPELWEMKLQIKSEDTRDLLDSLLAEKARAMSDAFMEENAIRTALQNKGKDLKKRVGWNSMNRTLIDAEIGTLHIAEKAAARKKAEFNDLRDLVRNAGFEVWNDFEWYLALKIN